VNIQDRKIASEFATLIDPGVFIPHLFGDTAGSGRRHRALDDTRMTARIWLKMEEQ
jgi:inhibitor of KinA sporulation pathway (predicted exonuclease)